MANEFKHTEVGVQLTEVEYDALTSHECDSQASGDILYFNGTNWVRLPKGANGLYLKMYAGLPSWETTTST